MDWIQVITQDDIENLLEAFGNFHDGVLREIHLWNSYSIDKELNMVSGDCSLNAHVLFQRQAASPSAIEIHFSEIQRMNITATQAGYWYTIYDASIFCQDNIFYWADEPEWNIDDPARDEAMWVSAKGIRWREQNDWIGNTMRYGSIDL
jgi:hypothetical protein